MSTFPTSLDSLTNPLGTDALTSPSHASQHANANDAIEAIEGAVGLRGTSFPGSPATDQRFYRTDYMMDFVWDGARWNCTCAHVLAFDEANMTSNTTVWGGIQRLVGSDLNLKSAYLAFIVNGGSALSASHKWVGTMSFGGGVFTIDSGASDTWRLDSKVINLLESNATGGIQVGNISWIKTGTPGTLLAFVHVRYLIVAT